LAPSIERMILAAQCLPPGFYDYQGGECTESIGNLLA
jgi:hypothetical protein